MNVENSCLYRIVQEGYSSVRYVKDILSKKQMKKFDDTIKGYFYENLIMNENEFGKFRNDVHALCKGYVSEDDINDIVGKAFDIVKYYNSKDNTYVVFNRNKFTDIIPISAMTTVLRKLVDLEMYTSCGTTLNTSYGYKAENITLKKIIDNDVDYVFIDYTYRTDNEERFGTNQNRYMIIRLDDGMEYIIKDDKFVLLDDTYKSLYDIMIDRYDEFRNIKRNGTLGVIGLLFAFIGVHIQLNKIVDLEGQSYEEKDLKFAKSKILNEIKVMLFNGIVNEGEDGFTIILPSVTMHDYALSVCRKSYNGIKHKNKCKHSRRGYYRKSNKGNYILCNNEYVKVENGTGTHIYIEPTIINNDNE